MICCASTCSGSFVFLSLLFHWHSLFQILDILSFLLLLRVLDSYFLSTDFFLTTKSAVLAIECSLFQMRNCSCKSFKLVCCFCGYRTSVHCITKWWPATSYYKHALRVIITPYLLYRASCIGTNYFKLLLPSWMGKSLSLRTQSVRDPFFDFQSYVSAEHSRAKI